MHVNVDETYEFGVVDPATEQEICRQLKQFWWKRFGSSLERDDIDNLMLEYRYNYFQPGKRTVREMIRAIFARVPLDQECSIVEVGCANGPLLHYIRDCLDIARVRFVGFEPYPPFVEDARSHFPRATLIEGDTAAFRSAPESVFGPLPVTFFFASVTLCMVGPDEVRRTLARAAEITDDVVIYDYCLNVTGAISPDRPVAFKYNEANHKIYFAHPFERYLADVGFHIVASGEVGVFDGKRGYMVFHARRETGRDN